jgi:hypothetical protein
MLVCVDPSGEPFDPAQDNTEEWVSTNDAKGCRFDLLECGDIAEAVEIASRHPMARFGRIEVRPVWSHD